MKPLLVVVVVAVAAAGCGDPLSERSDFGDNPGGLRMFARDVDAPRALVVFLHGCTESHDVVPRTGLLDIAPDVTVIAPEQAALNNPQLCFNWFLQDDITRDRGELESIHEMIEAAAVPQGTPVVAVGMSAGAAMSVAVAAAYPDVVAGAASFAGGPYGCAETLADSAACLAGAVEHSQAEWRDMLDHTGAEDAGLGDLAELRARQRMFIGQGTDDHVVSPSLAGALALQWSDVDEPTKTATASSDKGDVHIDDFGDNVRRELFAGMDHAMPLDVEAGCGEAGPFLDDVHFCAMREALAFLLP